MHWVVLWRWRHFAVERSAMNTWNGWRNTRPQGQNGRIAILHSEAARRAKYMDVLSDSEVRTGG